MKAEHRKELKTNALADKVGGMFKGAKSYAGAVWALLIIGAIVYFFYWWYSGNYADRIGLAWIDYLNASEGSTDDPTRMQEMADRRKGTTAEMPARLRVADIQYRQGYENLSNLPKKAADTLTEAKAGYETIAKNPGDCKEIGLRALIAVAKCQEGAGEFDEAKITYQRVLDQYGKQFRTPDDGPAHPLIIDAERSLAFLDSDIGKRLYRDWLGRHRLSSPVEPPPDKDPEKVPVTPIEPPPPPE